jgi:long-chain fatty acid transport protein
MADWRHIFYSATTAGNASFPIWYGSFGSSGGSGFDWRDTDSASFGAEWRTRQADARVGYHYSTLLMRWSRRCGAGALLRRPGFAS